MAKNKRLASVRIEGKDYSIRATAHSMDRMRTRRVDEITVVGNILAIGKDNIKSLLHDDDYMLIDTQNNVSIVFTREKNTLLVVTVIDKSNVFVKQGTKVIKL